MDTGGSCNRAILVSSSVLARESGVPGLSSNAYGSPLTYRASSTQPSLYTVEFVREVENKCHVRDKSPET